MEGISIDDEKGNSRFIGIDVYKYPSKIYLHHLNIEQK